MFAFAPETQRLLDEEMKSGGFSSPEQVIVAGIKLLQQRRASIVQIKEEIAAGLEEAMRGELFDGEAVFDDILGSLDREEQCPPNPTKSSVP